MPVLMSIQAMNWVWQYSEAGGTDRLVLLALADEADDDGGSCHPSIRRLAMKTRMHTSTVVDVIHRLEEQGRVVVTRPDKKGRGHFNRYQLVLESGPVDNPGNVRNPDPSETPSARVDHDKCAEMRGSDPRIPTDPEPDPPPPSVLHKDRSPKTLTALVVARVAEKITERDQPANPGGYAATVKKRLMRDHEGTIMAWIEDDQDLDSLTGRLLAVEFPDPVAVPDPVSGMAGAQQEQFARNRARMEADPEPAEPAPMPSGLRDLLASRPVELVPPPPDLRPVGDRCPQPIAEDHPFIEGLRVNGKSEDEIAETLTRLGRKIV